MMESMTDALDIAALLEETGALLEGHFRLSSGLHSPQYVQCARLLMHPQHAHRLGGALAAQLPRYRPELIVAPALGGLIIGFATADALGIPMIFTERREGEMSLRRGFRIEPGARVAVVEDVVTTGKSTIETDAVVRENGGSIVAHGAILNRSGRDNPFEEPFEFLHQLELESWTEDECRQCREGVPLDSPGSRFGARG
jgi:orotate phosphoribosyltransferase